MRRNLVLLDLLLAVLCGLGVWRFSVYRYEHLAAQKDFLDRREQPLPAPVVPIPQPPPPAVASSYVELAQKLILSADRNPTVVIEVVAPKIMPALPRAYGLMDMGNGAHVFLAATPGGPQKPYVKGDAIGEFKILEISRTGLVFGWEDKQVAASYEELKDGSATRAAAVQAAAPVRAQPQAARQVTSLEATPAKAAEPQRIASEAGAQGQPGGDPNAATRPCLPGDKSPEGTISGNYKKAIVYTPMGNSCGWTKVH